MQKLKIEMSGPGHFRTMLVRFRVIYIYSFKKLKGMKKLILAVFVIVFAVSCGPSTEIVKSWQEPGATVTPNSDNKALVIAMVKDEGSRRIIEDELVKRLNTKAVASYTLISADLLREASQETLNQKLKEANSHIYY